MQWRERGRDEENKREGMRKWKCGKAERERERERALPPPPPPSKKKAPILALKKQLWYTSRVP